MPTYDPNKTYIASVFDGIILKLRLTIDEFPDIAVNVGISQGDPNGVVTGSPGDVRIDLVTPTIWQKMTGELDEFGWVEVGGGLGPSVVGLLNAPYITYAADAVLINDRVATAGSNISFDLTTPGLFIINAVGGGGGTNLQTAITNQGAVPTTQAFDTRIQIGDGSSWQFEDQAGNDIVVIAGDTSATAFSVQGGNTAGGAGQAISLIAGAATVAGQNGGSATFQGGLGNGAGTGGTVFVTAGEGGATGQGGAMVVSGGPGGAVSGAGGTAIVQGGLPVDGNGGQLVLQGRNGVGTNRNGGLVIVAAGDATGSGIGASIAISAGDGGTTGTPGAVAITGGGAGSVSGDSGPVTISTQPTTSGSSASITLTTGNATGGVAGDIVARGGTGTTNGRMIVQPVWTGDAEAFAIIGNGANSATSGIHAGSRDPNGSVTGHRGALYMRNPGGGAAGAAYINTGTADTNTTWTQIATTSAVTLQAAIDGQSTTPTSQTFDTSLFLDGGAAWSFLNNAGNNLITIEDQAAIGILISGQDTAAGAGQDVSIGGGAATAAGQAGGDVILSGGGISTPGDTFGMVRINSAWALDSTISPAALAAGNNNNYAPTNGPQSNTWRLTPNAAGSTITGITSPQAGRKLELFNISTTAAITLTHNDTGNSTAANCFFLPNATSIVIPPLGSVALWYDTTSSRWRLDGAAGAATSPGISQVQDFTNTAGGSFDVAAAIAAGFTFCDVIVIGAGGGGGGGASSTTAGGANTPGGSAGGGGCRYQQQFRLSELTSPVAITVGAGGAGGVGGSNSSGSNGSTGGNSSFGTHVVAGGGGGGHGGVASGVQSGGAGGGLGSAGGVGLGTTNFDGGGGPGAVVPSGTNAGSASGGKGSGGVASNQDPGSAEWGGAAGGGSTASVMGNGGSSWWGGAGGGCGGGHTTGGAGITGGAGGQQRSLTAGGGGAPGTSGAVPTAGSPGTDGNFTTPGSGGGGGGGGANGAGTVPGAVGGQGGLYGNGGGGGGGTGGNGAGAPQPAGNGGAGAQGAVRVILS